MDYAIPKLAPGSRSSGNDPENVDESTRLLPPTHVAPGGESLSSNSESKASRTSLPKAQLGALFVVRIAEPLALTQISPYINQLLVDLHVAEPENVGFYSGLIESAQSLGQLFSIYQWGRVSDIVGRRLVMLVNVVGLAVSTIMIGLSQSFYGIIVSKSLGGFLGGSTAVINSALGEITDKTNQDIAMPIFSLAWPVGTILGPLIGGTLENAATRYPEFFAWAPFMEHPYLPPCLVSAACILVAVGLILGVVEETLPSKRNGVTSVPSPPASASSPDTNHTGPAHLSVRELLSVPAIRVLVISGFALNGLSLAFDAVVALFCYSSVESGGLGFEPSTTAKFLAFAGTFSVLLRLCMMSYILHNFDYAKSYAVCMALWPFAFAGLPILNAISRYQPFGTEARTEAAVWIGLGITLALSKTALIAYSLSILLVKQHAPSSSLGHSNGIVQFSMSMGRIVGPVLVNTLFTACNGSEWARRYGLAWTWAGVMVCLSLAGARVAKELVNYIFAHMLHPDANIQNEDLAWPMGAITGSFIGGALQNAATRYPGYFSWILWIILTFPLASSALGLRSQPQG